MYLINIIVTSSHFFCTDEASTKAGNVPIGVGAIAGIVSGAIIFMLFMLTFGVAIMFRLLKLRAEIETDVKYMQSLIQIL